MTSGGKDKTVAHTFGTVKWKGNIITPEDRAKTDMNVTIERLYTRKMPS